MTTGDEKSWVVVAVGGDVSAPCGIRIPVGYRVKTPELIGPLDGSFPTKPRPFFNEAVERGDVTLLSEPVAASESSLVGWAGSALLGISVIVNKLWQPAGDKAAAASFKGDSDRQILIAPHEVIVDLFRQIEQRIVVDYFESCVSETDPEDMLDSYERALLAALCTVPRPSNRRWDILRHLGHLYWLNSKQMKLEQLHKLHVAPMNDQDYDRFFVRVQRLQRSIEDRRRAHRYQKDLEAEYPQVDPRTQKFPAGYPLKSVSHGK